MNIVVVSDTHLTSVTHELERVCDEYCRNADLVIHLGDWETLEIYKFFCKYPLIGLAGNADSPSIKKILPHKKVIKIGKYRIGMIHGSGASFDLMRRLKNEFVDVDMVLFGHSHEPYQQKDGTTLWLNPGSLFWGRGQVDKSLAVINLGEIIESNIIML